MEEDQGRAGGFGKAAVCSGALQFLQGLQVTLLAAGGLCAAFLKGV